MTTAAELCPSLGCEYACRASLVGGECYCPTGKQVSNDTRTCIGKDPPHFMMKYFIYWFLISYVLDSENHIRLEIINLFKYLQIRMNAKNGVIVISSVSIQMALISASVMWVSFYKGTTEPVEPSLSQMKSTRWLYISLIMTKLWRWIYDYIS